MNSYMHAQSSARKWGGTPEDYLSVHEFIDSSKMVIGDVRHRSLYHHTLGVYLCQRIFGNVLKVPKSRIDGLFVSVPVRLVAERHIIEDLGWLPSPADYIDGMPIHPWMSGSKRTTLPLSHLLGPSSTDQESTPRLQPHQGACLDH
jgi:hypothetical protein